MNKEQLAKNTQDIKEVMGLSDVQYFWMVADAGNQFIDFTAHWTDLGKEMLKRWPPFWTWFRYRWETLDVILLKNMAIEQEVMSMENYLMFHHKSLGNELPRNFWNKIKEEIVDKEIDRHLNSVTK
jgi:hypothetical protein